MTEDVLVSVCCIDLRMSALNEALPHPIPAMSNSADHDRRALGIAAETLRNLADDHLYPDAFRHRIMSSVPHSGTGAVVQLLLLSTAARLDAMAERPEEVGCAHAVPHGSGVPIDNNWIENRIRPIALGRSNWLFTGSLRGGQRAAAVMSLIQSARVNGHDSYAYLKDVLDRLPTQPNSRIGALLPHLWKPPASI